MTMSRRARPFVVANFAITADGKISTRRRTPAQFSSARDKRSLLEIRAEADAILVGHATVATDAMTMGLPDAKMRAKRMARGQAEFPLRVIVTNSGKLNSDLRLFRTQAGRVVIFTSSRMSKRAETALRALDAIIHRHAGAAVRLSRLMRQLRVTHGVRRLVCEGGATLFRTLIEAGLVDQVYLTISPTIFGGRSAPTLTGEPGAFLPRSVELRRLSQTVTSDGEIFLKFAVRRTVQKK